MQDQLSEILFYVKGSLKYKWVFIVVAWLICVSGWLYVSTMPDKYQSEAKVTVDSSTMLTPLLRGMAIQTNTSGLVRVMQQLMFTRPNLEKIAKLIDPDFDSKTEAQKIGRVGGLKGSVKITGGRNDIFSIAYETTDAQKAQDVVHAVLTVFSEQTQQRGIADTGSAQQFIDEQINEYEVRLKNAEKARENFKRVNSGLLPNQGGGQIGQLNSTKSELQVARMALSEVNSRMQVLKRQLDEALETDEVEDEWGIGSTSSSISTPEDAKISALTERKNELLLKYTENHPDVLSIDATIRDLEMRKAQRIESMPETQNIISSGAMANPYIQSLKIALNNAEAQRASIGSKVYILNKRIEEIQQGMDRKLSIETEQQNLERDYSVIKSNYMQLIQRREQALMTENASNSQGVLRFKVVDAPTKPLSPSSPNRKLFNSIIFGLALAVGYVLAFLIYFIRPTFMSTQQVRSVTGLPILGSVAIQLKEGEKINRFNIILFWLFTLGLITVYIFVITNMFGYL